MSAAGCGPCRGGGVKHGVKSLFGMSALALALAAGVAGNLDASAERSSSLIAWSAGFASDMVLQATVNTGVALYGLAAPSLHNPDVTITAQGPANSQYQVEAVVTSADVNGTAWRAVLRPHSSGHDEWTFTAECGGCDPSTSIVLERVVFGSVFFCSGRTYSDHVASQSLRPC
eukprot:SAG31_NODE_2414_length_5736_cov_5.853823_4_plen_173_part_00